MDLLTNTKIQKLNGFRKLVELHQNTVFRKLNKIREIEDFQTKNSREHQLMKIKKNIGFHILWLSKDEKIFCMKLFFANLHAFSSFFYFYRMYLYEKALHFLLSHILCSSGLKKKKRKRKRNFHKIQILVTLGT